MFVLASRRAAAPRCRRPPRRARRGAPRPGAGRGGGAAGPEARERRAGRARALAARRGGRRPTRGCAGRATSSRSPSAPGEALLLEEATFVVFDLETTGLRPGRGAAVRVRRGARARARARGALPDAREPGRAAAAGRRRADRAARRGAAARAAGRGGRRGASSRSRATPCSSRTTRASTWRSSTTRRCGSPGSRVAATVVDTVGLARRLLGRQPANLAALSYRFATDARPCHRALPDAEATAEILLRLIGMAQERGARTVADLVELVGDAAAARAPQAQPRVRRAAAARRLPLPRRARPGALRRHARATCARACARTSAPTGSGRPSRAALAALERIEWRVLGSELEAGARGAAPDPRAAPAGERALGAARPLPLPAPSRRQRRLLRRSRPSSARSRAAAARSSRRARCRASSGRRSTTRCRSCARS